MAKIATKKPAKKQFTKSITVDAKAFKAALDMGVAERKTTIPILSNVLFQPQGNTLRLVTTDLDEMVITDLDAVCTVKEPFTLPWRKVVDLLKGEDGPLTFTPLENHWIKMSTGGVEYKLVGMNAVNFPAVPEIPKPQFQIPGNDLKEMPAHTTFAISLEESRYTLNGALFQISNGELLICATDGHRLALEKRSAELVAPKTLRAIVRSAPLAWLRKWIGKDALGLSFDVDSWKTPATVFSLPHIRTTFFSAKLTGQFPNYEAIMPRKDSQKAFASFDSAETFLKLLTKVAKCADERSGAVRIHLNGKATLSAQSTENGEATAVVPAVVIGDEILIGLNSSYISDVLKVAGKNAVTVSFKDNQMAGMFEIPKYPGFAYIVMPMRM